MRLPGALALLLVACGATQPQAREPGVERTQLDKAPRPYSLACINGCKGVNTCQACCAIDALIQWESAPSTDPFCQASHGCTNATGRFIYAEAEQCEFLRR